MAISHSGAEFLVPIVLLIFAEENLAGIKRNARVEIWLNTSFKPDFHSHLSPVAFLIEHA